MKQLDQARRGVSRETLSALNAFQDALLRWNSRINLISRQDEANMFERHIEDSLQLIPLIPVGTSRAIDLGSGGGFPGLVLAIATKISFDLVESDKRKATFLREAARITGAPATIHAARVEEAELEPAPLITARAFAPLPRLLDLGHGLLAPGGIFLLPKGKNVELELTQARATWKMNVEKFPSKTDPGATILRLSEVTRG